MVGLLDRGVVFAIAHVRGGRDVGRGDWFVQQRGSGANKTKGLQDYVDAADHLVANMWVEAWPGWLAGMTVAAAPAWQWSGGCGG